MPSTEPHDGAPPAPNHHAHHAPFSGLAGLLVGLSLTVNRGGDARLAADLVGLSPDDRVVDVGCGPGTAARLAAARAAEVTGVDPAPVMLRIARALSLGRGPVRWVEGAAEDLPVGDGEATVVWSLATVHHWADLDLGLAEVRRALAPGGRFLAVERRTGAGATGLASHGWTDEQAEAFATRAEDHGLAGAEVSRHRTGRGEVLAVRSTRT